MTLLLFFILQATCRIYIPFFSSQEKSKKKKKKVDDGPLSRIRVCLSRTEFEIVSGTGKNEWLRRAEDAQRIEVLGYFLWEHQHECFSVY